MTNLEQEIAEIKERNRRVEADKAWETSWSRKVLVAGLTYLVVVSVFWVAELPRTSVNAIIPSVAFVLSTLSIPLVKKWWLLKVYKKR